MAQQNFREARDHVAGLVQVERNFPEALAVMDTLPALWRERTVMQNFRLMAYLRLGHIDAFTDLLLQRPSISDWPAWAALPAYRSIISAPSPLSFNRATHNFFWAEPRESLRDALQEIPLIPLPAPQVHSIRRVVETATGQSIMHPDEWERRLLLGHSRDYYCRFLKKVEARFNRLQARGVAKVDPQLEKLVAENQILVEETDLKPITDILKSGRSVVLLELHGGHRPALNEAFERLSWPRSYIGNGVGVATRGEDFNVPTKGPRSHFDFAHLCEVKAKGRPRSGGSTSPLASVPRNWRISARPLLFSVARDGRIPESGPSSSRAQSSKTATARTPSTKNSSRSIAHAQLTCSPEIPSTSV